MESLVHRQLERNERAMEKSMTTTQSKTWRDLLAADIRENPARSNIDGLGPL
jgi:hypothetical protein